LLTAYSDRDLLLAAIQKGHVHDYVLKPWDGEDLELRLRACLEAYERRRRAARALVEMEQMRADANRDASQIVGLGGGLADMERVLDRVARTDATVILRGESGTGKELVAREVHRRSHRAAGPFVAVNCAALAEGLLESELFGHEAGAFTGAQKARIGRFEQAQGGTLFLDEIGDVTPATQVKLLRVLQERRLERVGGARSIPLDLRLVCATHRNLEQMVRSEKFREDLYHRLQVVPLVLPPLRARVGDIRALAQHFLTRFAAEQGKRLTLADDAIAALVRYDWPGNVRELRNVIERAVVLADAEGEVDRDELVFDFVASAAEPALAQGSVFAEIAAEEAEQIRAALRDARGSKARAARLLGIPRTTLNDRIKRLGIA
jgi:transcriptional regulator with PAS, ATPase and Fis domain